MCGYYVCCELQRRQRERGRKFKTSATTSERNLYEIKQPNKREI